ncbi:MAG: Cl-channel, voltage-gated family protein [Bacteroidota bacterium]|jgi:CIC family chloride channel protein|nr:Cl-channel, voltage-gated family protein [Bacteroidota bacterium]
MNQIKRIIYTSLITAAIVVGFFAALLANSLKQLTDYYEEKFFEHSGSHPYLFFILPVIGLFAIYFLRHTLFKNKANKGLTEIFDAVNNKQAILPAYKVPSHYFNGLLTVVFGGSTGIEVSTVVASAALGSIGHKRFRILREYKNELICAGAAAGITALFNSPFAGLLFSFEVISRRFTRLSVIMQLCSVGVAFLFNFLLHEKALLLMDGLYWKYNALPYFIILGILAGLNSTYLTATVIFIKKKFSAFKNEKLKILTGALIVGILLFIFPPLFGEGAHTIKNLLNGASTMYVKGILVSFVLILLLKPVCASLTLAAGGDGGIFAPSLFMGAVLGYVLAIVLNHFFNADVIPLNFMLVGMGSVLSSSIHAPLTAIFLICGLTGNYALIIPLAIACIISKLISKSILPYTVYTYKVEKVKKTGV